MEAPRSRVPALRSAWPGSCREWPRRWPDQGLGGRGRTGSYMLRSVRRGRRQQATCAVAARPRRCLGRDRTSARSSDVPGPSKSLPVHCLERGTRSARRRRTRAMASSGYADSRARGGPPTGEDLAAVRRPSQGSSAQLAEPCPPSGRRRQSPTVDRLPKATTSIRCAGVATRRRAVAASASGRRRWPWAPARQLSARFPRSPKTQKPTNDEADDFCRCRAIRAAPPAAGTRRPTPRAPTRPRSRSIGSTGGAPVQPAVPVRSRSRPSSVLRRGDAPARAPRGSGSPR